MTMGAMDATSCPMMGSMNMTSMNGTSGMAGMTGAGMGAMNGTTNMPGMSGMTGMGMSAQGGTMPDLTTADGAFSFLTLNPWWFLGWSLMVLLVLALLVGIVVGTIWLIRRTRPGKPIQSA
jgi:hypothetical protein